MAYLCPHPCEGKTEYGYCRYTWCVNPLHSNFGTAQQGQGVQKRIITKYDRIRAKSVEEMAEFMSQTGTEYSCPPPHYFAEKGFCRNELVDMSCKACWLDWLKQEVPTNG